MEHNADKDTDKWGIRFDPLSSSVVFGNNQVRNSRAGITMSADLSGCHIYGNKQERTTGEGAE